MNSDRWRRFVAQRKKMGFGRGIGLSGLLLNIVQRIPRYRLLLAVCLTCARWICSNRQEQDLLKRTEEEHPDYVDLSKTFDIVEQG